MKIIRIIILLPLVMISFFSSAQQMVMDINVGEQSSNPDNLVDVNGVLYFSAYTINEGYELWKSDGTEAGTVMVKDIATGTLGSLPTLLTNVNGILFFAAYTANGENELWKSDGTSAGTVIVKDINPNSGIYGGADPYKLINVNGTLFFTAVDGTVGYNRELWKSDGTIAGTVMVKNIDPTSGSYPENFININGTLFFSAKDDLGEGLWKSDGSLSGTVKLKEFSTLLDVYGISHFTKVNNTLYFLIDYFSNPSGFVELWKSDGTIAGTVTVKKIQLSPSSTTYLTSCNGELYFNATNGINGEELWKSDGTSAGTVMVKDINESSAGSYPMKLTTFNNELYFSAYTTDEGTELWKSDGTANGTVMVKAINDGIYSGNPGNLVVFKNSLLFRACDNDIYNPCNTWKTDGTNAGTIKHPNSNLDYGIENVHGQMISPAYAIVGNTTLFFSSLNGGYGRELWKYDGLKTEINETKNSSSFNIYPNPSNGIFHFSFDNILKGNDALEIYNMLGEKVYSADLKQQTTNEIDLSMSPKGIYLVQVYEGAKVYNRKIVVQ